MSKVCFQCNETKVLSEFAKHKTASDGHRNCCKNCRRAYFREYYKKHKERLYYSKSKFKRRKPKVQKVQNPGV